MYVYIGSISTAGTNNIWIVKPTNNNRGNGIRVFNTFAGVPPPLFLSLRPSLRPPSPAPSLPPHIQTHTHTHTRVHAPLCLQGLFQGGVVLNNPVVHHRHCPGGVAVRVGVDVIGRPVGGPPGVGNAKGALYRRLCCSPFNIHHLANLFYNAEGALPRAVHGAQPNARRVIAAVLQTLQTSYQNLQGLPRANWGQERAGQKNRPRKRARRIPTRGGLSK